MRLFRLSLAVVLAVGLLMQVDQQRADACTCKQLPATPEQAQRWFDSSEGAVVVNARDGEVVVERSYGGPPVGAHIDVYPSTLSSCAYEFDASPEGVRHFLRLNENRPSAYTVTLCGAFPLANVTEHQLRLIGVLESLASTGSIPQNAGEAQLPVTEQPATDINDDSHVMRWLIPAGVAALVILTGVELMVLRRRRTD